MVSLRRFLGIFLFGGRRICSSRQHFWEMWGFISEFHVAILVFYGIFDLCSTEVLVGKGCQIKAEVLLPACRFWEVL